MLITDIEVGQLVYFDPTKDNPYRAFTFSHVEKDQPFIVRVLSIQGEDDLLVGSINFWGDVDVEQVVKPSQLSCQPVAAEVATSALIEQLEWLAVEQKTIDQKTLLQIFGALPNGN